MIHMNQKSHIERNEIFPNVLSKFRLHSMFDASILDFIQLQFSVNWTSKNFYATFSQRLQYMFSELYVQSFSAIGLYRIGYEVFINSTHCTDWLTTFPSIAVRKYPHY